MENKDKKDREQTRARALKSVGHYYEKYKKLQSFLQRVAKPGLGCITDFILSAYVRNELEPEEEFEIEKHLRCCPRCSTAAMILRRKERIWNQACEKDTEGFLVLLSSEIFLEQSFLSSLLPEKL